MFCGKKNGIMVRNLDYTFGSSILTTYFVCGIYVHFGNIHQSGRYFSQERL